MEKQTERETGTPLNSKRKYELSVQSYLDELDKNISNLKGVVVNVSQPEKWDIWIQIEEVKKKRVGISLMLNKILATKDNNWMPLKYDLLLKYPELKSLSKK